MALALVPRARGRGEKSANFRQKSSTFDPILEGTRRKKTAAGTTGRWIDMRFRKPPGIYPDKLIGYWIEHRASRTSGSCGGNEHRSGSRCMFKLFCLFACLFSFDKHRSTGRSCGGNDPAAMNIEPAAAARGPVGLRLGPRGKGPLV